MRALFVAFFLLFVVKPAHAQRVDVSPYFTVPPRVGATVVFEVSDGPYEVHTAAASTPVKKYFSVAVDATSQGILSRTLLQVFPGKKVLLVGQEAEGFSYRTKKPLLLWKKKMKVGKEAGRCKSAYFQAAAFSGVRRGRICHYGTLLSPNAGSITTPAGTYSDLMEFEEWFVLFLPMLDDGSYRDVVCVATSKRAPLKGEIVSRNLCRTYDQDGNVVGERIWTAVRIAEQ